MNNKSGASMYGLSRREYIARDPFALLASALFHIGYMDVDNQQRDEAKTEYLKAAYGVCTPNSEIVTAYRRWLVSEPSLLGRTRQYQQWSGNRFYRTGR